MSFAENLRIAREANGFSLDHLSELTGISQAAITQWENGASYPRVDEMDALSKALDLDAEAMITEDEMGRYIDFSLSGGGPTSTVGDLSMVALIILALAPGFVTGSFLVGALGGGVGVAAGYFFRKYYIKRHG